MLVNFVKMQGLGNDFVIIDLLTQSLRVHASLIKHIADRHLGIGCDQVLLIEPPIRKDADFFYRIYNADGQEVEQCGNGARCAARFFYDSGFATSTVLKADCLSGPTEFHIEPHEISMTLGHPRFDPKSIPFLVSQEADSYSIMLEDNPSEISVVSFGNPHAILLVPNVDTAPVRKLGPLLSKHSLFPNQTNVEFMEIVDRSHIRLRIWERGVGETLACGTGAAAAAVVGIRLGLLTHPVKVEFPHGHLTIHWPNTSAAVTMKGPAINVFLGRFRL